MMKSKRRATIHSLILAAKKGETKDITEILNKGVDPNGSDKDGLTPLMAAAENECAEALEILLKKHADKNAQDNAGRTPLIWVMLSENPLSGCIKPGCLEILLEAGADPNLAANDGKTVLRYAASQGDPTEVGELLEADADPNLAANDGTTPLMCVACKGEGTYQKILQLLLEYGADPNAKDGSRRTALYYAAESGHSSLLDPLRSAGADPRIPGGDDLSQPLTVAAARGDQTVVSELLKNRRPNPDPFKPNVPFEPNVHPDCLNARGETPLMKAAGNGQEEVVKILLEQKAETALRDKTGKTALVHAVTNGHDRAAGLLLDSKPVNPAAGVSPDEKWRGVTVLALAVENNHEKVVQLLLDKGAEPKAKNLDGQTARMLALFGLIASSGRAFRLTSNAVKGVDPLGHRPHMELVKRIRVWNLLRPRILKWWVIGLLLLMLASIPSFLALGGKAMASALFSAVCSLVWPLFS